MGSEGDVFPCRTNPFGIEKSGKQVFLLRVMNKKQAADGHILLEKAWSECRQMHLIFSVSLRNRRRWRGNQSLCRPSQSFLFMMLNKKVMFILCDLKTCQIQRCIAYDKLENQNNFFISHEVILSLPGMGQ